MLSQTTLNERDHIPARIAARIRVDFHAHFCGNVKWFAVAFTQFAEKMLASVNVSGIEEIHPQVKSLRERGQHLALIPIAHRPSTSADRRDFPAGASQFAVFHFVSPLA